MEQPISDVEFITEIAKETFNGEKVQYLEPSHIMRGEGKFSAKFQKRYLRIVEHLKKSTWLTPSIYGPKGITDG